MKEKGCSTTLEEFSSSENMSQENDTIALEKEITLCEKCFVCEVLLSRSQQEESCSSNGFHLVTRGRLFDVGVKVNVEPNDGIFDVSPENDRASPSLNPPPQSFPLGQTEETLRSYTQQNITCDVKFLVPPA